MNIITENLFYIILIFMYYNLTWVAHPQTHQIKVK